MKFGFFIFSCRVLNSFFCSQILHPAMQVRGVKGRQFLQFCSPWFMMFVKLVGSSVPCRVVWALSLFMLGFF